MTRLLTLLAFAPLSAMAQAWRTDEGEGDALLLAGMVCLGVAFFWLRLMAKRGKAVEGAMVLAVIALLAAMFPPARWVLACGAAAVLAYGIVWRT